MKKTVLFLSVALCVPFLAYAATVESAPAKPEPAPVVAPTPAPDAAQAKKPAPKPLTHKQDLIKHFIQLSGQGEIGQQVLQQLVENFKQAMPKVPAEFWDTFVKELSADELTALIIPIYDAHFTEDDILALIAFYNSPVGKKMIAEQPAITRESIEVGQRWGAATAQRIIETLKAKGYSIQ